MNRFGFFIALIGLVGLVMVWASGVDLVYSRVGFGMIILGGALGLLALGSLIETRQQARYSVILACLGGAGYFVWRALSGGPVGLAVPDVVQVLLFVVVYYLVFVSDLRVKRWILAGLGLVCLVQVGVAAAQISMENSFYVWKENPEKLGNTSGLFGHYNPFAAFLNGSVFFFLSYLCVGQKMAWRVVCGILVVGILAGLVVSGSRGGWVSLVMGLVIWMLLLMGYLWQVKSKAFGLVFLLGIVVCIGGIGSTVWAVQKITEKRTEKVREDKGPKINSKVSDGGRLAMQQIAFEIFLDSPAVGQGARSFSYLSLENWDPDKLQLWMGNLDFAHNEYLQTLSDYGAVGLLIIIGLLILHGVLGLFGILWNHGVGLRDSSPVWQLGAAGGLVAILTQCFFSFLMHVPSLICLVALQLAILAGWGEGKSGKMPRVVGRGVALVMLGVAVVSGILGWQFSNSFLNRQEALRMLPFIETELEAEAVLSKLEKAGNMAWDPLEFERAGQEAMRYAMNADEARRPKVAHRFRKRARILFERVLVLNPHSAVALCGLPQVEDALGNFAEAEDGHQLAMKRIWSREYHLRPHFFAARSAYTQGYYYYQDGNRENATRHFRLAKERIEKRREILIEFRELEDTKQLRVGVCSWLVFLEAERLFLEGDRVWKKASPRDPERAHALMVAAETRYKRSRKDLEAIEPRWKVQWDNLQKNLELFKLVKVSTAELTPEEIEAIANPEAVLDSSPENR
ncbi:O-antigen ligase family protein [bacterium]|nr:O-antigen ligase family protein [bacterium]